MKAVVACPKSKVITVRVPGPLEPYVREFKDLLAQRGYTPLSRVPHLQVMAHLSKWLSARDLTVWDLTHARVREYLIQRYERGYTAFCTLASVAPLLEVLTAAGAPLSETRDESAVLSPVETLVADYARFLRQERGLADTTTAAYVLRARRFIDDYGHGADVSGVDTAAVTRAVLAETGRVSAGSAQFFSVALRSFLRYCHMVGLIATDVSGASLPVTRRRHEALPKGITVGQGQALLGACDRRTTAGRRDYAVIVLLMRLGLRACEVAALRLDDVDWRAGLIMVRGKDHRLDQLPLPADVGEAIAAYVRYARTNDAGIRHVFVRTIAPHAGLSREAVGWVVRRACARAGLVPFGPHRLRHAWVCDMVRAGAGLVEIGQLLRHRDTTSTSIYARVDIDQLSTLAQPLPERSLP